MALLVFGEGSAVPGESGRSWCKAKLVKKEKKNPKRELKTLGEPVLPWEMCAAPGDRVAGGLVLHSGGSAVT